MKFYTVTMWVGVTFVILMLLYACVIFVQHVARNPVRPNPRAGVVPMIYVGVLEVSIIQEAMFYPA